MNSLAASSTEGKIRKGSGEHTVRPDSRIRATLLEAKITLANKSLKGSSPLSFVFSPQRWHPVLTEIWLRHCHRPLWYWCGSSWRMVAHVIQRLVHSFSRILPCCNFFYVTEKEKIKDKLNTKCPSILYTWLGITSWKSCLLFLPHIFLPFSSHPNPFEIIYHLLVIYFFFRPFAPAILTFYALLLNNYFYWHNSWILLWYWKSVIKTHLPDYLIVQKLFTLVLSVVFYILKYTAILHSAIDDHFAEFWKDKWLFCQSQLLCSLPHHEN